MKPTSGEKRLTMQAHRADEDARRTYWTQQMEAAYGFMQVMMDYPVKECGEPMVSLRDAVKEAGVAVLFSETKIAGQFERVFYLREDLTRRSRNQTGFTFRNGDGISKTL